MKQLLAPAILGLALTGCVSTGMWSEAPHDDYYYSSGAPVGWWGSNVGSVDVFYGALAGYGRWDIYPGYGRVFIPAGIGPRWQPYSRGYWVNDPRYGRRWISNEPFGWATYHYGRWGRDSRLGWFWVPDTRFGPSWVDWRSSGGYVSWAPLPPIGWSRYARYGYGWGNDWWLHAPSTYAYRPGMQQHVRRGRPDFVPDRPGSNQPGTGDPRPRGNDVVDGRHPRSDDWQRGDRSRPGLEREGRHPRSAPEAWVGESGGAVAPATPYPVRQPRGQVRGEVRPDGAFGNTPQMRRNPGNPGNSDRAGRPAPASAPAQSVQVRSVPQAAPVREAPVRAAPPREAAVREAAPRMSPRSTESGAATQPD